MSKFENKIQAKDLRIGNYLKANIGVGVLCKVLGIDATTNKAKIEFLDGNYKGQSGWFTYDLFIPIPLTEEWLLKLGFSSEEYKDKSKHIGIDFANLDFTLVKPGSLDFEHIKHFGFEFEAGGWPRLKQFKYVHELQNFFYCYTGEELEVKI